MNSTRENSDSLDLNPMSYQYFGLEANIDYNKNIWNDSIEEKSRYADAICRKYVDNVEFLKKQFSKPLILDNDNIPLLNTGSLGNIAFLALNSPEPYKTFAKSRLEQIMNSEACKLHFANSTLDLPSCNLM
jgi:hypothetical protein